MPTCTPGGTTTTHYGLCKPADGETNWGTAYRTSMDTIDSTMFNIGIPRSYLAGMQTTPNTAATSISIAVGVCMGNDQATSMQLTSPLVKVFSSTWVVGSNNGGMASSTSIQANQTYHLFVIIRTDTSVVDAYADTSVTAANIPSPYTVFRRIASFKTAATNANMINYVQDGDLFEWVTPVIETTTANPGVAAITQTLLGAPSGINVQVTMNVVNVNATLIYFSDLATTDIAASATVAPLAQIGGGASKLNGQIQVRTNTSAQIRYRLSQSGGGDQALIVVTSYIDTRGRNS